MVPRRVLRPRLVLDGGRGPPARALRRVSAVGRVHLLVCRWSGAVRRWLQQAIEALGDAEDGRAGPDQSELRMEAPTRSLDEQKLSHSRVHSMGRHPAPMVGKQEEAGAAPGTATAARWAHSSPQAPVGATRCRSSRRRSVVPGVGYLIVCAHCFPLPDTGRS